MAGQSDAWFEPPLRMFQVVMRHCDSVSIKTMRQVCVQWKVAIDFNMDELKPRTLPVVLPNLYPGLRVLDATNCIGPSMIQFQQMGQLTRLQRLMIRGNYTTGHEHVGCLLSLTNLRRLKLIQAKSLTDLGLHALTSFNSLEELALWGADGVTGEGLSVLTTCNQLQSLDLRACRNVGAEGLRAIGRLTQLVHLNLNNTGLAPPFEDLSAASLQKVAELGDALTFMINSLPGLVTLALNDCGSLGHTCVAALGSALSSLTHLEIGGCLTEEDEPDLLGNLRSLRVLKIAFWSVGPASLRQLAGSLSGLEVLMLQYDDLSDEHLYAMTALTNLRVLDLPTCLSVSDAGLGAMTRNLSLLRSLSVTGSDITLSSPLALHSSAPLQFLDLSRSDKLMGCVKFPENHGALKAVNLSRCIFVSGIPTASEGFSGLQKLQLQMCEGLAPITIAGLSALTALLELELGNTRTNDGTLLALTTLTRLTRLDVATTKVTNKGMLAMCSFRNLRDLNLTNCPIRDGCLHNLRFCTALQRLNCSYCRFLSNSQCIQDLTHLAQCSLATVLFQGCPRVGSDILAKIQATTL